MSFANPIFTAFVHMYLPFELVYHLNHTLAHPQELSFVLHHTYSPLFSLA
jgi:hypothetical protein